jgi:hypothetical protein
MIYVLRRPLLAFRDSALSENASMTVHAYIANRHGHYARVRLLASALSVVALIGLITAEAFAHPQQLDSRDWITIAVTDDFVGIRAALAGAMPAHKHLNCEFDFAVLLYGVHLIHSPMALNFAGTGGPR